jgi:hypothetical protein
MKQIYIDDLQIHDWQDNTLGYLVNGSIEGLAFPELRKSSYQRPGEHGDYLSNTLYSGRVITLSGRVWGDSLEQFNQRRRALQQYFTYQKDSNGIPVKHTLKFTTTDDLDLQVKVVAHGPMRMSHRSLLVTEWQIDLYSPDFYIESQTEQTTGLLTPYGGGFVLPFVLPVVFEDQVGGSIIVRNNGTTQYYPTITLNGDLTHPVIYNTTINKYLDLNHTIGSTDTPVIVNMKDKTIKQGSTPLISKRTAGSSWWWLEPGDNVITLTTSDSGDDGNIQITFRDSYIGV